MTMWRDLRVMWLQNHTAARRFEIPMLKACGITQIFTPKRYPAELSFRSASVEWCEDQALNIPKGDLDRLNAIDWYGATDRAAWELASRYFDICFVNVYRYQALKHASQHFAGAVVWRAYGQPGAITYSTRLDQMSRGTGFEAIRRLGARFYFGKAYDHIDEAEAPALKSRSVFLPLGLDDVIVAQDWSGDQKMVFFICPDIAYNVYYEKIYRSFTREFAGIPYRIGGAQPLPVVDDKVLGFTSAAEHRDNMRQMRVMFYHSTESNHVHYHPFEAVRAGMPLVFMAGGLLDRIGGKDLPGRCDSPALARRIIGRLLDDDWNLIEQIRRRQTILLDAMKPATCLPAWRAGLERILAELKTHRVEHAQRSVERTRIAVIVPVAYRGGSLRGAILLAQTIRDGSRQCGEPAEVVLAHLNEPGSYPDELFHDLGPNIARRPFSWRVLRPDEARRAMLYAGHPDWSDRLQYQVADDGINDLLDCDLWVVVSDRLSVPLLPMRPCVHMVYDYVQRYVPFMPKGADQPFLNAVRRADRVLVTTEFTRRDALQYAGLPDSRVVKVPILIPDCAEKPSSEHRSVSPYFHWTTNAGPHKNHDAALEALEHYYEALDGALSCRVTGVDVATLLDKPLPHLTRAAARFQANETLRRRITWEGELPDRRYRSILAGAAFLWHPTLIDNGTFSVIEAAALGVPSLSSDYPAMREIDDAFKLSLAWMNADDPWDMAERLKEMETRYNARRALLPNPACLARHNDAVSIQYWKALSECL